MSNEFGDSWMILGIHETFEIDEPQPEKCKKMTTDYIFVGIALRVEVRLNSFNF